MKRNVKLILVSIVVLFIVVGTIFWFVNNKESDIANKEENNEVEETNNENNVLDNNDNDNNSNDENNEPKLVNPIEVLDYYGEECLAIEDTIERGDCLQELGKVNINWYVNEEKHQFYFPFQREQSHWQYLFYKDVDENDQLGSVQEGESFEEMDESSLEAGEEAFEEFWHVISNLIPKDNREYLKALYWVDTGEEYVLAVGNKDPDSMYLLLSELATQYHPRVRYLVFHELGHVLTLNSSQVDVHEDLFDAEGDELEQIVEEIEANCETIFANGRCMKEDSYIYDYYKQFWEDIYDTHAEIDWENEEEFEEFFFEYEDRFFNTYQATSFVEDIAEMFAYFIHSHSSMTEESDMKYEKIKFFYEIDEFVELRTNILENLREMIITENKVY
ncbi:MAG TPA: hypothetical protein VK061_05725 [Bacillota bacterium]|nr:hypothetical protein [Bacillota bacterium]